MPNLRVIIIAVLLMMTSCGCKDSVSADNFSKIQKRLFEIRTYKCTAEISYYNNKNTTCYTINQYYAHPGKYRVEVVFPDFLKGLTTVTNGKDTVVINPNESTNSKYYYESVSGFTSNNTFITEFFSNYVKSENSKMNVKDNKYVLQTTVTSGNSYMDTETLTILPNGQPDKLEVYDQDRNLKILLEYKEFLVNPKLDDDIFDLTN